MTPSSCIVVDNTATGLCSLKMSNMEGKFRDMAKTEVKPVSPTALTIGETLSRAGNEATIVTKPRHCFYVESGSSILSIHRYCQYINVSSIICPTQEEMDICFDFWNMHSHTEGDIGDEFDDSMEGNSFIAYTRSCQALSPKTLLFGDDKQVFKMT
ncbi:hypothetical protein KIN20_034564 [Parelaphostrongylus tenuis]|uniref:Uncharacterized protein n=1 Tax=Parelaphostrongylus tenuis TaxID=148309 RepID=A0AAD5WJR8_PARTN|nr:hypothetical protein KIN20_034564 [Parelaphostrongylus tenuis]